MDENALFKITSGLYVVGVKNAETYGGSIVDALIQATAGDPTYIIYCGMNNNYTTELVKQTGEFTVSVLNSDVDPFIIGNFGYQSSRTVEKWANAEHEIKDGLPVLKHAAAYLRCKLEEVNVLSTHNVITAIVEDAWLGEGDPLLYIDYFKVLKNEVGAAFAEYKASGSPPVFKNKTAVASKEQKEKTEKWVCTVCGYVYEDKIPFEDLSDDWACPLCGAGKPFFVKQWV